MSVSDIGYYYAESGDIELILTQGQARIYPRHMHMRHWTAGLVRCGSVSLATDTGVHRLHAGQHYCICPYEPHSLSVAPKSSLLVVCFDGSRAMPLNCAPFVRKHEKAWLDTVVSACNGSVYPHVLRANSPAARDSLFARSILEVLRLVMENPAEAFPVVQMTAYAGYSRWHFLRAFKKVMGMTPHAFQLLCRLRLVRSLLRSDTASSAAAVSAGFSDQSHMHKVFKRHHGMSPGEFRRACFKPALLQI